MAVKYYIPICHDSAQQITPLFQSIVTSLRLNEGLINSQSHFAGKLGSRDIYRSLSYLFFFAFVYLFCSSTIRIKEPINYQHRVNLARVSHSPDTVCTNLSLAQH